MKKVLIVDDEPIIREGLPHIIDWQYYGFEIVGAAQNGIEGIKLIQEYQPDLVITDIRMPEMDGLEMIHTAKQRGVSFYSIILSGYSEFSYAQKAIRLGTVSYLLKPIDEDELTDILQRISKIEQNRKPDFAPSEELKKNIFEGIQISLSHEYKLANLVCFSKQSTAEEFQTWVKGIKDVLCYLLIHDDYTYVLVLTVDEIDLDAVVEKLIILAQEKKEVIFESSLLNKSHPLNQLYKEIRLLKEMTFTYSNLSVISKERIKFLQIQSLYTGNITEKLLTTVLNDGDLSDSFIKYKENFIYKPMNENEIKWAVINDFHIVVGKVIEAIQPLKRERFQELVRIVQDCIAGSENLEELLCDIRIKYSLLQEAINESLNRINTIQEIELYTKKHYKEDLNLKIISEYFNYNNAYIGKKFKKETGISYSQYLDEIRMGKAKQLIKDSKLMIYEIAERTGYMNLDYFYKKFKRFYGMSPNEYRKLKG